MFPGRGCPGLLLPATRRAIVINSPWPSPPARQTRKKQPDNRAWEHGLLLPAWSCLAGQLPDHPQNQGLVSSYAFGVGVKVSSSV
jgi:hypothetical protein